MPTRAERCRYLASHRRVILKAVARRYFNSNTLVVENDDDYSITAPVAIVLIHVCAEQS